MRVNSILRTFFSILLFIAVNNTALAQDQWDWHISGGKIVDGTGTYGGYKADILIRGDSIGYMGAVDADTIEVKQTVDASGKIVSPGFIDVHAHGNPLDTPKFQNFLAMGVTTILLGQDGSSVTSGSLQKWFEKVKKAKPAVNIAVMAGHGSLRQKIGVGKQPANEQELNRMTKYLQADLKAGAFGMSTGLEYVPGLYADESELVLLAKVVGKHDGIIMSHMRSEDDSKIERSIKELAKQGEYARVHASHLKVVYGKGKDRANEILLQIEKHRREGIKFSADTYPYAASYTGIGILFPKWAKTEAEWQQAMNEQPVILRSFLEQKLKQRNGADAILFGSGKYAGKTLHEAAEKEKLEPVELLMQIGPGAASAAHFVMNEELQDRIATAPSIMISSDGSPTMYHPRGYGSFAKVIHRYVVEQKTISIEEAVYKISVLPAKTIGLADWGILKVGNKADIIIFNPEKVYDTATFSHPHRLAKGFDWIWVNGELARQKGLFTEARSGEVLRKNGRPNREK